MEELRKLLEVIADAVRRRGQDEDSSPLPQLAAELLPTREASKRSSRPSPPSPGRQARARLERSPGAVQSSRVKTSPPAVASILGDRLRALSEAIWGYGMALENLGDIDKQTISAEGFSGQAFSTYVPHTVRAKETKQCTDCHVAADGRRLPVLGREWRGFTWLMVFIAAAMAGLPLTFGFIIIFLLGYRMMVKYFPSDAPIS